MEETARDTIRGLSASEVADRVAHGKVNTNTDVQTKTVGQIVSEHTFTLFNGINLFMFILVLFTAELRNALFMGVVLSNLAIGVFQEIRAKRMVDKLSILTAKTVRVRRGDATVELAFEDLVLDDVVLLARGDQIPADAVVISGSAFVDESLLTGEGNSIEKSAGSELFSGSFVDAGSVWARLTRVGADSYAARINAGAKYIKPVHSEILDTLRIIIEVATVLIFPLGIGLFLRTFLMDGSGLNAAILSTVAAVIGMIPQGLVLLTSTVLAIATTRLAARKVLVQQSHCVETLARVDVLCLDKTGTITTGRMLVSGMTGIEGGAPGKGAVEAARAFVTVADANAADANDTARAILAYGLERGIEAGACVRAVPFDSAYKYSGCVTRDGRALIMGAPRFILPEGDPALRMLGRFDPVERVLVSCEADGFDARGRIQGKIRPLGFVSIRDEIRASAPDTIRFFAEQGVELRVISGDDPRTVSAIAASVGIEHAERAVDASRLKTDGELRAAARDARVFGRVTPDQKRSLIKYLQAGKHVVAMTGDGVNDVLALKEADCSISMASASAAARNVSELVLADNDFAHIPEIVAEGRRSINNLQRSASLFLMKTVYSMLLAFACIVMPPYPFIPIQMSLISTAVIGIPSFVLALEPNRDRVEGSFIANVFMRSLPASASIVAALFTAIVSGRILGMSFSEISTLCMVLTALVGIALIVSISRPLTVLRGALIVVVGAIMITGCFFFSDFFHTALDRVAVWVLAVVVGSASVILFICLFKRAERDLAQGGVSSRGLARIKDRYATRKKRFLGRCRVGTGRLFLKHRKHTP
ncbi:HAD family hydrolase [Coriobacteriales bacterium OH1046]|nr:HAD family hydrolase [Coriobacteriales bacterium OH1046]